MVDAKEKAAPRLRELADVLGVPVDRFYEEAPTPSPEDTAELLWLWHRLTSPGGRLAALEALNKILDEHGR